MITLADMNSLDSLISCRFHQEVSSIEYWLFFGMMRSQTTLQPFLTLDLCDLSDDRFFRNTYP